MTPAPHLCALALLAPVLAGCNARTALPPAYFSSLDRMANAGASDSASAPAPRGPDATLLRLPAWVGPQRVVQRTEDGRGERIFVRAEPRDGDGQDFGVVRLGSVGGSGEADPALSGKPTEAGIRAELTALFPDTPMRVVTRPARNAHGPYGLAVGLRPDGARCLYAWQWIEPDSGEPASLRLRLCRTRTTLDALAGAVDHLRFDPTGLAPDRTAPARPARRPHAHRVARADRSADPPPASAPTWSSPPRGSPTGGSPAPGTVTLDASATGRLAPVPTLAAGTPMSVARTDLPAEALRGPLRAAGNLDVTRR